jgi:hypothetical protein
MAAQIVRVWKGYGTADGVRRYCDDYFATTLLPQLREFTGFLGARLLVRALDNETELVVATVWQSMDSVRGFAGDDYDTAVVEPIVHDLLVRVDDHVAHFSIALSSTV